MNKKKLILITSIIIISSCLKKNNPIIISELPLSSNIPIQLESNIGESNVTEIIENNELYQLLFTHNADIKKYQADMQIFSMRKDDLSFSKAKIILPSKNKINRVLSSIIKNDNGYSVYYTEANSLKEITKNYRANIKGGMLYDIKPVEIERPLKLIDWQKYYLLPNGNIALIYRNFKGVFFSTSNNGLSFNKHIKVGERGAMISFAINNYGHYFYSYQIRSQTKGAMITNFSYSQDEGKTWSEPTLITTSSDNSHDAYLFNRIDGNIDIYYIYPIGKWRGFSLFRRCIKKDFTFGVEQQVVEKEFGNLAKPSAHRIFTGEILLTFIEQNSGYNLYTTKINGDAPCD